jgi:hypothetical protein
MAEVKVIFGKAFFLLEFISSLWCSNFFVVTEIWGFFKFKIYATELDVITSSLIMVFESHIKLYDTISYHIMLYHIISYHITTPHQTISCHVISYHIMQFHTTQSHITPYHKVLHHIKWRYIL